MWLVLLRGLSGKPQVLTGDGAPGFRQSSVEISQAVPLLRGHSSAFRVLVGIPFIKMSLYSVLVFKVRILRSGGKYSQPREASALGDSGVRTCGRAITSLFSDGLSGSPWDTRGQNTCSQPLRTSVKKETHSFLFLL